MSDPVEWPTNLPDCAQSWSERDAPDIVITSMDVGPPKVRRRSTLLNNAVDVSWTIDANLYQSFNDFYRTTCQQGVIPFNYKHPITKTVNAYRFASAPEFSFIRGKNGVGAFSVSVQLELQE